MTNLTWAERDKTPQFDASTPVSARIRERLDLARLRLEKIVRLLVLPRAWQLSVKALRHGVFPSLEHRAIRFGADFATVLDVGAARGQFALFALSQFPRAQVVCFEPVAEAAAVARSVLPAGRVLVRNIALGSAAGSVPIHISMRDDSSSLLPIGVGQVTVYPGTEMVRQETVSVEVLETYLLSGAVASPCLLKIDVQGFELEVLKGAGRALGQIDEILVEASFMELYSGQPLAHEIVSFLAEAGFALVDVCGIARTGSGDAVQGDFLFRRPRSQKG